MKLKTAGLLLSILGTAISIADGFVRDKTLDEKVAKAVNNALPKT